MAPVFTGSKLTTVEVGSDWAPIPGDLGEATGKARIRAAEDGIAIEPSSLEEWLEKIEVQVAEKEALEPNGWFSDGSTITYMLDDLPKQRPLRTLLHVRTGGR